MSRILARPPEEIPFWKLVKENNIFLIPTYQRPFAWDENRQIKDFWEDIYTSFKTGNARSYLLGNIYLASINSLNELENYIHEEIFKLFFYGIKTKGKDLKDLTKHWQPVNFYLIVDGQQRITTFFLLIKAFCDSKIEFPEKIELVLQFDEREELPKLILGSTDAEFFKKLLNNEEISPKTLSNKRLLAAYHFFKSKISSLSSKEIKEFFKYLINCVNIIRSEISSLEYATTLFISQTDRGKELTYLERLKSLLSFYVYTKFPENDRPKFLNYIDKTFGETFELLDSLIENSIFSNEREVEEYFFKIIKIREEIDNKSNGDLREARRILPDKAYEEIRINLRKLFQSTLKMEEGIKKYLEVVKEINQLFNYIISNLNNSHFASVFKLLKPSPQTYAFLSKLHSKYPDLDFEKKCFKWERKHEKLEKFFEEEKKKVLEKINKNISQEEKAFLNQKLLNITYSRKKDSVSILNLVELLELAVWKAGKEPVQKFKDAWKAAFNQSSEEGIINAFNCYFLESYRYDYLKNFAHFGFIYNEYEKDVFNNDLLNKILESEMSKEHIFPQDEKEIKDNLNDFGFADLDDYKYFVEENPGNWILLEKKLNSKVKDYPPFIKGFKYVEFFDLQSQKKQKSSKVKSVKKLGEELINLADYSKNKPSPAFRYLLEIRRLELISWLYNRFI